MKAQLEAATDELKREIHIREKCYPKWLAEGKLTRAEAATRLGAMKAAVNFTTFLEDMGDLVSKEYAAWLQTKEIKNSTDHGE